MTLTSDVVADTLMLTSADALYAQIQAVLQQARQQAKRSVNQTMVQTYWQIGKLIVEHEQGLLETVPGRGKRNTAYARPVQADPNLSLLSGLEDNNAVEI